MKNVSRIAVTISDIHYIIDAFSNSQNYEYIPTSVYLSKSKQHALNEMKKAIKSIEKEDHKQFHFSPDDLDAMMETLIQDYKMLYHKTPSWYQ